MNAHEDFNESCTVIDLIDAINEIKRLRSDVKALADGNESIANECLALRAQLQNAEPVAEVVLEKFADFMPAKPTLKWLNPDLEVGTKLFTHPPKDSTEPIGLLKDAINKVIRVYGNGQPKQLEDAILLLKHAINNPPASKDSSVKRDLCRKVANQMVEEMDTGKPFFCDDDLTRIINQVMNESPDKDQAAKDWNEKRMDVISQNGNDGLHYDK